MNPDYATQFDRLEATRKDLVGRLEARDHVVLNRPRADGGWSVVQVLSHVISAESGTRRYISRKMLGGTSLPPAGFTSGARLLALKLAMVSPVRFRAPAITAEVPEEADPAAVFAQWDEVREKWRRLLDEFPDEIRDRMVFRHTLVGLMGMDDTLVFLQTHLDHHARQIDRLLDAGPQEVSK